MIYNNLGKTGLQISQLSLGTWLTIGDRLSDPEAEKILALAYERGVNFFDSAESYNSGKSDEALGRLIKKLQWPRSTFLVSGKAFFGDGGTKPNQTGLSRKHLVECCHDSLKRLQLDYLDLYFCHRPDKSTPVEETVWTMNLLIQQGKVLYWGTSEWSAQEIMEAHMFARQNNLIGPVVEQPIYNMFARQKVEAEFNQLYKTVGLGTTTWSPLSSGVLTNKYFGQFPSNTRLSYEGLDWLKKRSYSLEKVILAKSLQELAQDLGISLTKLAIAWCAKNPNVSSVILGASSLHQLEENLDALNCLTLLDESVLNQIEDILNNKPELPQY